MKQNANGVVKGLRKAKFKNWDNIDLLPREAKEIIWNAPVNMTVSTFEGVNAATCVRWRQHIQKALHASCLATYGPDHPQAYPPVLRTLSLEDLDLE